MARTKNHYINNKDLYEAMVKYKESVKKAQIEGKQLPQVPNYVGVCFLMICNKLSTKPNFVNYTYRDEMVADGIENCVAAAHSFDPLKSNNPFAYFTQIAWNAFIRRIAKEKKQTYIKHKNFEYTNLLEEMLEENFMVGAKINNEYSDDIIKTFENKLVKTQKKSKIGVEKFTKDKSNEEFTSSTD